MLLFTSDVEPRLSRDHAFVEVLEPEWPGEIRMPVFQTLTGARASPAEPWREITEFGMV
jgi:hypothetical protein